jgi:hypothetical protein
MTRPASRRPEPVQLEFELPGTGEAIWAAGEIAYEARAPYLYTSAIRLTALPRMHARLLRDYVREQRKQQLSLLLDRIRAHRYH